MGFLDSFYIWRDRNTKSVERLPLTIATFGTKIYDTEGNQISNISQWDNTIKTSKYTTYNFLFKNIVEQFSHFANCYFLIMGALQLIPEVSDSNGTPTFLFPLLIVVGIAAVRDAFEDAKRHRSDNEENSRVVEHFVDGSFVPVAWSSLRVGDIIQVRNSSPLPADILLLRTSSEFGVCYVETKNLDGETNLKHKSVIPEISAASENLSSLKARIVYEPASERLYEFDGKVTVFDEGEAEDQAKLMKPLHHPHTWRHSVAAAPPRSIDIPYPHGNPNNSSNPTHHRRSTVRIGKSYSVSPSQFLLRGSSLQNTKWCIGVVVYTGHQTRILRNAKAQSQQKWSELQRQYNKHSFVLFLLQILLCIIVATAGVIWLDPSHWYLAFSGPLRGAEAFREWVVIFFRQILLFSYYVPITLYVQMELTRTMQAYFLRSDKETTDSISGKNANCQTSTLMEELGAVTHVFSDKTGTLTQNLMQLRTVCVGNDVLGLIDPQMKVAQDDKKIVTVYANTGMEKPQTPPEEQILVPEVMNRKTVKDMQMLPKDVDLYADIKTEEFVRVASKSLPLILHSARQIPSQAERLQAFLQCLALCHTVLIRTDSPVVEEPPLVKVPHKRKKGVHPHSSSASRKGKGTDFTLTLPEDHPVARKDIEIPIQTSLLERGRYAEVDDPEALRTQGVFASPITRRKSIRRLPVQETGEPLAVDETRSYALLSKTNTGISTRTVEVGRFEILKKETREGTKHLLWFLFGRFFSSNNTKKDTATIYDDERDDDSSSDSSMNFNTGEEFSDSESDSELSPIHSRESDRTVHFTELPTILTERNEIPFYRQDDSPFPSRDESVIIKKDDNSVSRKEVIDEKNLTIRETIHGKDILSNDFDSQSPDELALVCTAAKLGAIFLSRPSLRTIKIGCIEKVTDHLLAPSFSSSSATSGPDFSSHYPVITYEIMEVLDFDNFRKRMSVIVRDIDGGYKLLIKGADTSMLSIASETEREMNDVIKLQVHSMALKGLRTLVLGWKEVTESDLRSFKQQWIKAKCLTGEAKEEEMNRCLESIEKDIFLSGCTGIEDKLQEQVPQTIAELHQAGVKIWVLTGDKMETAISIGRSCNLLPEGTYNAIVDGVDYDSISNQLNTFNDYCVAASLVNEGIRDEDFDENAGDQFSTSQCSDNESDMGDMFDSSQIPNNKRNIFRFFSSNNKPQDIEKGVEDVENRIETEVVEGQAECKTPTAVTSPQVGPTMIPLSRVMRLLSKTKKDDDTPYPIDPDISSFAEDSKSNTMHHPFHSSHNLSSLPPLSPPPLDSVDNPHDDISSKRNSRKSQRTPLPSKFSAIISQATNLLKPAAPPSPSDPKRINEIIATISNGNANRLRQSAHLKAPVQASSPALSLSSSLLSSSPPPIPSSISSVSLISAKTPASPVLSTVLKGYKSLSMTVTGEALHFILRYRKLRILFFKLTRTCETLIASRVTPKQKAQIVKQCSAFQRNTVSLAIGDGANDVAMILSAHVGVGIEGKEGSQAVRCADFSISQFRFLSKLMFVHGKEALRKNALQLYYTIFKNVAFCMVSFYFCFASGFSGLDIYDSYVKQLYNLFFTTIPIVLFAIFDRELPHRILERCAFMFPALRGRDGISSFTSMKIFWRWYFYACYVGCVCYYVPIIAMQSGGSGGINMLGEVNVVGFVSFFSVVLAMNGVIVFIITTWYKFMYWSLLVGPATYYLFSLVAMYGGLSPELNYVFGVLHSCFIYYAVLLICLILSLIPIAMWKFHHIIRKPDPATIIRERIYQGVYDIVVAYRREGKFAALVPRDVDDDYGGFAFSYPEKYKNARKKNKSWFKDVIKKSAALLTNQTQPKQYSNEHEVEGENEEEVTEGIQPEEGLTTPAEDQTEGVKAVEDASHATKDHFGEAHQVFTGEAAVSNESKVDGQKENEKLAHKQMERDSKTNETIAGDSKGDGILENGGKEEEDGEAARREEA